MKIVEVETVRVDSFPNLIFVRLHTDEGIHGLGETFYGAEAVETHLLSVAAPLLIGEDPLQLEHLTGRLSGYVGYAGTGVEMRARSAVDLALWDILGQVTGQPLHNLLGGRTRERIRIYNTCAGPQYVNAASGQSVANWGVRPGEYEDLYAAINHPGQLARELLAAGITGMKIWPFDEYAEASGGHHISDRDMAAAIGKIAAIRDTAGMEMDVMVELHALWDVPSAQRILRALEPLDPFWVEDPVRSDVVDGLARVSRDTPIRIAASETVAGVRGYLPLLDAGGVGVVNVDTTWAGGLTVAHRVAALADAYGVPIAPHDCTGPVALTACVHLASAAPNVLIQETVRAGYLGWYAGLVEGGPVIDHGWIRPPDQPGLGVRLLPDLLERPGSHAQALR